MLFLTSPICEAYISNVNLLNNLSAQPRNQDIDTLPLHLSSPPVGRILLSLQVCVWAWILCLGGRWAKKKRILFIFVLSPFTFIIHFNRVTGSAVCLTRD